MIQQSFVKNCSLAELIFKSINTGLLTFSDNALVYFYSRQCNRG